MITIIARDFKTLRIYIDEFSNNRVVSMVPTMGSIHLGHLALIKEAKKKSDYVIVTIFLNPKQFNREIDYKNYPSDEDRDISLLKKAEVNLVFIPDIKDIYPSEFSTYVNVRKYENILCGASRPGHFSGVATIVAKLLSLIRPKIAFFGEKDYQQFLIIKRLSEDLNFNCNIICVETVREIDGLAISSRNNLLSVDSRKKAPLIYKSLLVASNMLRIDRDPIKICNNIKGDLLSHGFKRIEYVEVRRNIDLELLEKDSSDESRIFIATYINKVRLIDNIRIMFN